MESPLPGLDLSSEQIADRFADLVAARLVGPLSFALCAALREEEAAEEAPTEGPQAGARTPRPPEKTRPKRPRNGAKALGEEHEASEGMSVSSANSSRRQHESGDGLRKPAWGRPEDLRQLESSIGDELFRMHCIRTDWRIEDRAAKLAAVVPSSNGARRSMDALPGCGMEQVRQMRVLELTNEHLEQADEEPPPNIVIGLVCPVLRIVGVLPWDLGKDSSARCRCRPSVCYQRLVMLALALVTSACLWRSADLWEQLRCQDCGPPPDTEARLLSDSPVAVFALMAMLVLGAGLGSKRFCKCNLVLLGYMHQAGFLEQWRRRHRMETLVVMPSWACAVLIRVLGTMMPVANTVGCREGGLPDAALFAAASAMLMGIVYTIHYVCNGLEGVLDLFGQFAMSQSNLTGAVHKWNVLQAVLRNASSALEWVVLVLQAGVLVVVVFGTVDVLRLGASPFHVVPAGLAVAYVLRGLAKAAVITDKCARVPSLVNSLSFGRSMDAERQYVVQYIQNSAAGFHVFETRFDSLLVFDYVYTCVLAAMFAPRVF